MFPHCPFLSIIVGTVSVTAQPQGQAADIGSKTTPIDGLRPTASTTDRLLRAVSVEHPPTLDGDVLGDPVWSLIEPASGFRQSAPDEGEHATERTEVRIAFTADTVYFGVVCYDREPSAIIVSDSRRDSSMNEADSFQLILDTFHDQQNGFVFGTTPAGQEYDGQVTDEGGGRSLFGGAASRVVAVADST